MHNREISTVTVSFECHFIKVFWIHATFPFFYQCAFFIGSLCVILLGVFFPVFSNLLVFCPQINTCPYSCSYSVLNKKGFKN